MDAAGRIKLVSWPASTIVVVVGGPSGDAHRAAGLVNRHRSAIGKAWRSSAIVLLQLWSGIPEKNRKIRSRWSGWDLVETSSDKASVVRRVIDDMQNHFATRHCAFPTADKIEANNFL